jgi:hypothetical protein
MKRVVMKFPRPVVVETAMGKWYRGIGRAICAGAMFAAVLFAGGCGATAPVSTHQILRQQALLDFTGLLPNHDNEILKVSWAVPRDWDALALKRGPMFVHQQYRSPSGVAGVGVAYVRLPFPLPTGVVAWLAQREYLRRYADNREGRVIESWTDDAGREWFEAENNKYHGTGYIMCRGHEAWIVYSGYRVNQTPNAEEISVSRRSARTIIPFAND